MDRSRMGTLLDTQELRRQADADSPAWHRPSLFFFLCSLPLTRLSLPPTFLNTLPAGVTQLGNLGPHLARPELAERGVLAGEGGGNARYSRSSDVGRCVGALGDIQYVRQRAN